MMLMKNKTGADQKTQPTTVSRKNYWEKISRIAIELLILGILILPALIFSPWHSRPFELPKNAVFLTLTLWLLFFYLIYKFQVRDFKIKRSQKIILIVLAIWFVFKFISLLLSPNFSLSFWGGYVRQEGFITHLFLIIWFVIAADYFENLKQIKRYLLALCVTAGIIALYGVLQKFGVDFSALIWDEMAYHRVASTLGNPLFLSVFLIFTVGYSIFLFKETRNIYWRLAISLSVILQILALVFTFTSSSLLAIVGGLIFGGIFYFWRGKKFFSHLIIGLTVIGLIFFALIIGGKIFSEKSFEIFEDLSLNNQSNFQRIYAWQSAFGAIAEKPLFGWGLENFSAGFEAHALTKLVFPLEINFDRAHNFILDSLVMEGVFATLAWLAFLIFPIIQGVKRYFREKQILYLIAASLIFGAIMNFCVSVPTITGYILLFFTIAIIFHEKKAVFAGKVNLIYQNLLINLYAILAALAIFGTMQFFRPWQADLLLQKALIQNNALARADGIALAVAKWPYREFWGELYKTEKFIIEQAREKDETIYLKYKDDAKETVDELLKNYGNYYSTQIIAADYYAVISDEMKMTWFYERAVNLAPTRHDIYWFWGDSLLKLNKKDEALAKYQQAIDIDPSLEYPRQKLEEFKNNSIRLFQPRLD